MSVECLDWNSRSVFSFGFPPTLRGLSSGRGPEGTKILSFVGLKNFLIWVLFAWCWPGPQCWLGSVDRKDKEFLEPTKWFKWLWMIGDNHSSDKLWWWREKGQREDMSMCRIAGLVPAWELFRKLKLLSHASTPRFHIAYQKMILLSEKKQVLQQTWGKGGRSQQNDSLRDVCKIWSWFDEPHSTSNQFTVLSPEVITISKDSLLAGCESKLGILWILCYVCSQFEEKRELAGARQGVEKLWGYGSMCRMAGLAHA